MESIRPEKELQSEFEAEVASCRTHLIRVARKMGLSLPAAEDIVQDALEHAWRGYRRFERRTGFYYWVRRIMINLLLTKRSRPANQETMDLHELELYLADPRPTPEEECFSISEEFWRITEAMRYLSRENRIIFWLSEYEGMPDAEIAVHVGLTLSAVKQRLFRSRRSVRRWLGVSD